MERFFNTAGPQKADINYTIDPLKRFDLDEILMLVRQQRYFVMHAPRQTGKTSCMLALRDYLNAEDDYIAVYANVEGGQAARNDAQRVVKSIVDTLAEQFRGVVKSIPECLADFRIRCSVNRTGGIVQNQNIRLCQNCPRNAKTLFLSAGNVHTALSQVRIQTVGHMPDEILCTAFHKSSSEASGFPQSRFSRMVPENRVFFCKTMLTAVRKCSMV